MNQTTHMLSYQHLINALLALLLTACSSSQEDGAALLNVSYDPTREFYSEYNNAFAADWEKATGQPITIRQSHGGSGKQARAVIHGLQADVVSLALALDIDQIARQTDLLPKEWQDRLPNHSVPYTSIIVFLVRKDNPKQIYDWEDLLREDVKVITPNPKTSGGARWNYLAAYGYALRKNQGDHEKATRFMQQLYQNAPILDTGARAAATTFAQRAIGDVLITWENEAYLVLQELSEDAFEVIIPSLTIIAEPPVAWIDKNNDRHQNRRAAEAYLRGLYSPAAQRLAAKHFLRPIDKAVLKENAGRFPPVQALHIEDFGGWDEAQRTHFDDGGKFDHIYTPSKSSQ